MPQPNHMNRLANLQLLGPAAVLVAAGGAELAALSLGRWPSSELLWYLNLEWFHAFQKSNSALSAYDGANFSQFWIIAFPLAAAALCGAALKRPLLLAAASNLSLVYASFVFAADCMYGQWRTASLSIMTISSTPHFLIGVGLVVASLVSFAVSHFYYIRTVRNGVG